MKFFFNKIYFIIAIMISLSTATTWAKPAGRPAPAHNSNLMTSWGSEEEYEAQSSLSGGSYQTTKRGNDNVSTLEAQLSLAKLIKNNIQAGGELHFVNNSGPASGSYFEVAAFGVYNLTSILKDTFYVKGGAGTYNTVNTRGENESKFGFFIGGGKRIPMWNQITYTPEARLLKIGDQDMTFRIYFLNFSLFF